MQNKILLLYVPLPSYESAMEMAQSLINNRLAACCNIIPKVTSVYSWNGKIENSEESVLIIKTLEIKLEEITLFIQEKHTYDVPCILNLNQCTVNSSYFDWMLSSIT